MNLTDDIWESSSPYEYFMGRWSALMAPVFLKWLNFSNDKSWLDLGCGTGALTGAIIQNFKPAYVCGVDPSAKFLEKAKLVVDEDTDFLQGSSDDIPLSRNSFDVVVSGLALNFFPDLPAAFTEIKRVLKKDGTIAAYVWDYSEGMEFLRYFWDAAKEEDEMAAKFDEGNRFSLCNTENLISAFKDAQLTEIKTSFLNINTVFKDFDDFWKPFLGGQGPAPGYLTSLDAARQGKIRQILFDRMPLSPDGSIKLTARALAIRGVYYKYI